MPARTHNIWDNASITTSWSTLGRCLPQIRASHCNLHQLRQHGLDNVLRDRSTRFRSFDASRIRFNPKWKALLLRSGTEIIHNGLRHKVSRLLVGTVATPWYPSKARYPRRPVENRLYSMSLYLSQETIPGVPHSIYQTPLGHLFSRYQFSLFG